MARPAPASGPEDLFDAIARLVEPGQRAYFYQRMLYFRHLRPEDELLRLVEAIGFLALLIREAPQAVALQREQMAQLLETSIATIHAAGEAEHADPPQAGGRLAPPPPPLAHRFSVEWTRAICVLCGAAWLLGMLGGIAFERWRDAGRQGVPQAIVVPTQMAEPTSSAVVNSRTSTPATPQDRRRASQMPYG